MIFMPSSLLVWCRWWGEEGRLTGSRRRSNNSLVFFVFLLFYDFIVVVVFVIVAITNNKVIRIKGARAKPKHREGRTSNRLHVANGVPQ